MEHNTRPEREIPQTLAKIAGLLQTNPALGERALRTYAAMHGLSPEEALALLQAGDLEAPPPIPATTLAPQTPLGGLRRPP